MLGVVHMNQSAQHVAVFGAATVRFQVAQNRTWLIQENLVASFNVKDVCRTGDRPKRVEAKPFAVYPMNWVLLAQHGAGSVEELFVGIRIGDHKGVSGFFDVGWLTI